VPRRVLRRHLGDQEDLVTAVGDRLADQPLGLSVGIRFSRIFRPIAAMRRRRERRVRRAGARVSRR
jgi:hypothetical protein